METADPAVVAANNLKAGPDEVFRAIRIVNELGGGRRDNVPELLPGLNFVCGLTGETGKTYELNEQFLGTGPGCGPCGAAGEYPAGDAV